MTDHYHSLSSLPKSFIRQLAKWNFMEGNGPEKEDGMRSFFGGFLFFLAIILVALPTQMVDPFELFLLSLGLSGMVGIAVEYGVILLLLGIGMYFLTQPRRR